MPAIIAATVYGMMVYSVPALNDFSVGWLSIVLYALAIPFLIWALANLVNPKEGLPFALPEKQTRINACLFALRFAIMLVLAATALIYEEEQIGVTVWGGLISGVLAGRTPTVYRQLANRQNPSKCL